MIDESVRIGGQPLNEVAEYRVNTNNFLASGGDGFTVFTRGTDTAVGARHRQFGYGRYPARKHSGRIPPGESKRVEQFRRGGSRSQRTGERMRPLVVALIFAIVFLACCYMASKGYRGLATSRSEGYGEYLPDHVLTDPDRREKANRMVFRWAGAAAALCLPPIGYLAYILAGPERRLSLPALVLLAVHMLVVITMAGYPLEKFKSYGDAA